MLILPLAGRGCNARRGGQFPFLQISVSGIQAWAVQIGYVRSKEIQMLEILIVLVIALIVFGPMLLKARKHTDD